MKKLARYKQDLQNNYKICDECKLQLDLDSFFKYKHNSYHAICKKCYKRKNNEYYRKNIEIIKKQNKEYYYKNKNYILERQKHIINSNKELHNLKRKEYRQKSYVKKRANKAKRDYHNKMKYNPIYKLKRVLRGRLYMAIQKIKKDNMKKPFSYTETTKKFLGCTFQELKLHLESLFLPNMTWDNYGAQKGKWCIDHTIPLRAINVLKEDEIKNCLHYTNLKPMWFIDNCKKIDMLPNGKLAREIKHDYSNLSTLSQQNSISFLGIA